MSRSRRKQPVVTLQQRKSQKARKTVKLAKRVAARAVRVAEEVPSGKAYRKFSPSWDICDYKSWYPEGGEKVRRK